MADHSTHPTQNAHHATEPIDAERKKGAAELLVLSLLDERSRHGYELAQLIEQRSRGALTFHVSSLYTLLYRLERRKLVRGRWVEKPGERRRRFYELTAAGVKALAEEERQWRALVAAVERVADLSISSVLAGEPGRA